MIIFIRTVLTQVTLFLATLILAPVGIILIPLTFGRAIHPISKMWGGSVLLASGVKIRAKGFDQIPTDRPVIFMLNHQGNFDIFAMTKYLPTPFKGIAKKELFKIPLFGWALRASGFISIDRSNRVKAIKSLEKAKTLFANGISLAVFPEGTRSLDGTLGRLKKGGFHLALESQVDIVPITFSGSWKVQRKGSLWIHPGTVDMVAGKVISTQGMVPKQRHELLEQVRVAMAAGFTENN